jgi:hypothetical protein
MEKKGWRMRERRDKERLREEEEWRKDGGQVEEW